jgi:hypothetical protein
MKDDVYCHCFAMSQLHIRRCDDRGCKHLRNVGKLPPDCPVQQPSTQPFSCRRRENLTTHTRSSGGLQGNWAESHPGPYLLTLCAVRNSGKNRPLASGTSTALQGQRKVASRKQSRRTRWGGGGGAGLGAQTKAIGQLRSAAACLSGS